MACACCCLMALLTKTAPHWELPLWGRLACPVPLHQFTQGPDKDHGWLQGGGDNKGHVGTPLVVGAGCCLRFAATWRHSLNSGRDEALAWAHPQAAEVVGQSAFSLCRTAGKTGDLLESLLLQRGSLCGRWIRPVDQRPSISYLNRETALLMWTFPCLLSSPFWFCVPSSPFCPSKSTWML